MDVNILVYAHHAQSVRHAEYAAWLEQLANGQEPFGVSELVMSGFLRIVTQAKIYANPSPLEEALAFLDALRVRPNFVLASPGAQHWTIFTDLLRRTGASGNSVPDAYHAALAIELGAQWVSADTGFARFPGLRWQNPLA